MSGTGKFIALCKELESAVKTRYGSTSHGESAYVFLSRKAEFKPYTKELDLIREVRNLIQHKDVEVKGKEAIYVDEVLMDALREIIGLVRHPETVGDVCTRDLVTAGLSTPVKEVMDRMLDSSFSHIPVLDGGNHQVILIFTEVFQILDDLSDGFLIEYMDHHQDAGVPVLPDLSGVHQLEEDSLQPPADPVPTV